jgi:hypothetical protein
MKRLVLSIISMVAFVTACSPDTEWDRMGSNDTLTNALRAQYSSVLLPKGFRSLRISCEKDSTNATNTAKHIHLYYYFTSYPSRSIDLPPSECEYGPAVKIEAWSGRYSPMQLFANSRREYTIEAVKPYIDAMLADQVRDHL